MRFPNARITTTRPALPLAALASAVALAVAACGGSGAPQAAASAPASHHPMASASDHMGHMTAARFGADCGMVPASGMGSFHSMAMEPLVTAASHNPLLSTFAADVKQAGLAGELDMAHGITVFAPTDSAFGKLPAASMSMLHSRAELAKILKYHVTRGQVSSAKLASGMALPTLEGDTITPARMGSVYEVNHAQVVCGNVQTANGTIDIVNMVLMPMH